MRVPRDLRAPPPTTATGVAVLYVAQAVVAVLRRHGPLAGLVSEIPWMGGAMTYRVQLLPSRAVCRIA